MKKIIALLLAVVLCFALVACGGSAKTEEMLIGTWTCEREAGQDNVEQATTYTLELYQGGTCYKYNLGKENGKKYNNHTGTWSVEGDILTITLSKATLGFVIDMSDSAQTLTMQINNSIVLEKQW